ncbi:hypothetical protein SEVIR_5G434500v4 [Setaria viridis]|uniref:Uncharacterized protein n=2 Tax=Setaria TaxID=4554 RepID=K3XM01_SETIT|nr:uncharacterized protein LOC101759224 [Setaria italica]XP_034597156.1 uncharacterized protein LOC117858234 [Setaria viridis]RCV28758.1 hypothetical protein SETIT_5G428600v2 [Setaria italica]TKW18499.1 hypothetical protein SEVIR_5G434500v2 [Setaria viridis]
MGSPPLTVHLRRSSFSSPPGDTVAIAVDGSSGVDLARVGLALGLDPASVRPNGYFLSRGPGHVCSAVTWRALLDFFAARGLPTGADAAAPVAVDGKPAAPPASTSDPTTLVCSKRKSGLEVERRPKKSKPQENRPALSKRRDDVLSEEIVLSLKRRLRLDDTIPAKKIKQVEYGSDTQQPVKFSCSFVNANGKRPRDEMITSLSCKRVR